MDAYAGDVSPREAWQMLKENPEATLVDIRTEGEWQMVGVPDISSLGRAPIFVEFVTYPRGEFNPHFFAQLAEAGVKPGTDAPVLFICRSAHRSMYAAAAATEQGIRPSYNVTEGFEGRHAYYGGDGSDGWKAAGLPWRNMEDSRGGANVP